MVVITEDNNEVQSFVPGAQEIEVWVDQRKEDITFSRSLGTFIMRACQRFIIPLIGELHSDN